MSEARLTYAGQVGVPGIGQRVCGRCRGNGLLSKLVANYPGYAMCESCDGTGVKAIKA